MFAMSRRSWDAVLAEHAVVIDALAHAGPLLERVAEVLFNCLHDGRVLYVFGNGGSAADAQHITAELVGRYRCERRALAAVALTTDSSGLTALGNDLGFERVFARQLEALGRRGDAAWALSTSGRSPNVLAALRTARERHMVTIGFTGNDGGGMADLCDLLLRVPHSAADRVQEAHELAYHFVCEQLEARVAEQG
jgi:D-sedoheptulose 7-phosphate isomerase